METDRVLILGYKGMLGGQLIKIFPGATGWDREDADVLDIENLKFKIQNLKIKPEVIVNCVAYNDVDGAEEKSDAAYKLNSWFVGQLSTLCKELGIILVHFSSNYVFDGVSGEYRESDAPSPQSVYAKSKAEGEQLLQKNTDRFYLIRTAVLFGPKGESELSKKSFIDLMLDLSAKTDTIKAVADEINSVTYAPDLAAAVKSLIADKLPYGIYHVTNSGQASWFDLAKEIFAASGKNIEVVPVSSAEFPRKAARPKKSVLVNTKLPAMRPWQQALSEFLNLKS